jgi:hypothetical protein
MQKCTWLVMTNCDPAHESEFNAWYDDIHLGDLLRIPGIVAARRAKLSNVQAKFVDGILTLGDSKLIDAKFRYVAFYNIESDDVASVLEVIKARAGTSEMVISPYLTDAYTVMYEDL